jgi:hypothetical protein
MTISSLHATGSIAAHQVLDFIDGDSVEIARYRMFQAARGNGKSEGLLPVFIGVQAKDQRGREAVTTANAVMMSVIS